MFLFFSMFYFSACLMRELGERGPKARGIIRPIGGMYGACLQLWAKSRKTKYHKKKPMQCLSRCAVWAYQRDSMPINPTTGPTVNL